MSHDSQNILKNILGKIIPRQSANAKTAKHSKDDNRNLGAFETRLNKILKSHTGEEMKDQVFMIDLSKISVRLGQKWDDSIDKIHAKIDAIVKSQITTQDLFIRRDDTTYLVVFDGLPQLQGHLKANMLNEEIARALVGEAEATKLTCVKDVIIDKNGEVTVINAPNKDQLIADIVTKADQERSASGEDSYESPMILEDIDFIYRPMLVTRTRVVSTYVCIPVRKDSHGQFSSGYNVLGPYCSPQEIFELDHMTQHVAADELSRLLDGHGRSLIALPVHFETLASVKRRMKYLANIEQVMKSHTDRIVFEMVGLPDNIPQPRILELTSALRSHSRAIIARFSVDHGNFPAYRTAGLHAVGIDLFNLNKPEKALIKDLEQFVENAKQNQLRTYVHGLRTISMLTASICAGFDYLDGYALSSVATGALDVKGFSLAAPYLQYQKQSQAN